MGAHGKDDGRERDCSHVFRRRIRRDKAGRRFSIELVGAPLRLEVLA